LRALSSCYVERRGRLDAGAPLASAGKRAAFALYYAPLHFLAIRAIARELIGEEALTIPAHVVDLGCGTGAAGAAVALACGKGATVEGYDVNPWAIREAGFTYRTLKVDGRAHVSRIERVAVPRRRALLVAAFVVNELPNEAARYMLRWFIDAARLGHQVLVVEPIARRLLPWWPHWEDEWMEAGGASREWRIAVDLPPLLKDLDQATGLRHRELTARTLVLGG
jgi:SAM-dependent methyltransferase